MARSPSSRHRRILSELEQRPSLRVSELAERLEVSTETIRRDLDRLTEEGLLDRTYGGAVRRRSLEPSVSERHGMRAAERERIARRACEGLAGASHFFIGSGATTVHVARRIALEMNNVTVVVHSFGVATVLALNPTIRIIMAPGNYHASEGAMFGSATLRFLDRHNVDVALLGASGLTPEGVTDALLEAGDVYAVMAARAGRTMLVADSSKFGVAFPALWARWEDIDALVSDEAPPRGLARALEAGGVAVSVA